MSDFILTSLKNQSKDTEFHVEESGFADDTPILFEMIRKLTEYKLMLQKYFKRSGIEVYVGDRTQLENH